MAVRVCFHLRPHKRLLWRSVQHSVAFGRFLNLVAAAGVTYSAENVEERQKEAAGSITVCLLRDGRDLTCVQAAFLNAGVFFGIHMSFLLLNLV